MSVYGFETFWVEISRTPEHLDGDGTFHLEEFLKMLYEFGINLHRLPSDRHHKMIFDRTLYNLVIFIRTKTCNTEHSDNMSAIRTICICKDTYGFDTMYSFEMARG